MFVVVAVHFFVFLQGNIQSLVNNSGVLAGRNLLHPAGLTKEVWQKKYKGASAKTKRGKQHNSHAHNLGPVWSKIMLAKTWNTVGEPQLRLDAAAWHWLQVGSGIDTEQPQPLASSRFSKLMMLGFLARDTSADSDDGDETRHKWCLSLNHAVWGALVWPLDKIRDGIWMMSRDLHRGVEWVHVTTPSTWMCYPYRGVQDVGGVAFQQQGPSEPLLKAALRKKHCLNHDDLLRLLPAYGLAAESADPGRKDLLRQLALHVGDEAFAEEVLKMDTAPVKKATTRLAEDPLFNLAYDELVPEDQQEFSEVKEARQRGQVRKCTEALKAQAARKRARIARAKAKAKPKAKAEARPLPVDDVPPVAAPPLEPVAAPPPEPLAAPLADIAPPPPPPPLPPAAAARRPRDDRALPWGTSWVLAEVHSRGELSAWSVRCSLHANSCNKSLNFGTQFIPEEAQRRIQEWCIRGLAIPAGPDARNEHMRMNPRFFPNAEVRPIAELTRIAEMPR